MSEKAKGIGLFGLIGMVVSSCIGSGVRASPAPVLCWWPGPSSVSASPPLPCR